MNHVQQDVKDANFGAVPEEARAALRVEKLHEAIAHVAAGDNRQVTVELDIAEHGHRDPLREIGTLSIQEAAALTYFLEYHRDYDYARAAGVRVEDFGPLGFDQMSEGDMYTAPHDGLSATASGILYDLRIELDCNRNSEECFVQYRIR